MGSGAIIIVELIIVLGVVFGLAFWELYRLRKLRKRREQKQDKDEK